MFKKVVLILITCFSISSFSQEIDKEDGATLLRKDYSFGLNFNANAGATGWGMAFEYAAQKTFKYRRTYGFTLTNIRHPKEFKIYSLLSNSRGYYFGKLNSLVSFRGTYGGKLTLFKAKRENGIEITYKWKIGPSVNIFKPVYLRINKFGNTIQEEKYNPAVHNTENIASRAAWSEGLREASIKFGGFLKTGFDFNFSTVNNKISGGEVGIMVDYIIGSPLLIIHNNPGENLFASIYLQFNLGQKLY